jgi:hypothetical protein
MVAHTLRQGGPPRLGADGSTIQQSLIKARPIVPTSQGQRRKILAVYLDPANFMNVVSRVEPSDPS